MKNIYALLITLCLSAGVHSQQITIGAYGGWNINTAPFSAKDVYASVNGRSTAVYGLKATYGKDKWQFGIGADQSYYMYQTMQKPSGTASGTLAPIGGAKMNHQINIIYPYVLANYTIPLGRSSVFLGAHAGYAITGPKATYYKRSTYTQVTAQSDLAYAGIQAGYRLKLTKGWSIEAEVRARYLALNTSYTTTFSYFTPGELPVKTAAFTSPVTLGVNYSFGKHK